MGPFQNNEDGQRDDPLANPGTGADDTSIADQQQDDYIKHFNYLYRQRLLNAPLIFLSSAFLVCVTLLVIHMVAGAPNSRPDPVQVFNNWEQLEPLRTNLRDDMLYVTAGLLALLGITSLAQTPGQNSDTETIVRQRVSQNLAMVTAFGLACYAWLTLPLSTSEMDEPQSWHGAVVLFIASAVAMLIGPDRVQRLVNARHLAARISRTEARQAEIRNHLASSEDEPASQTVKGWMTREWRATVNNVGFPENYGLRPRVRKRHFFALVPWVAFVLPAVLWGVSGFSQELRAGRSVDLAWVMPGTFAAMLLATTASVAAMHYTLKWDPGVTSRWPHALPVIIAIIMGILWLFLGIASAQGAPSYMIGNFICLALAVIWPLIRLRMLRDNLLVVEDRSLGKKKKRDLRRQSVLEGA